MYTFSDLRFVLPTKLIWTGTRRESTRITAKFLNYSLGTAALLLHSLRSAVPRSETARIETQTLSVFDLAQARSDSPRHDARTLPPAPPPLP
jgi:hypothetical protein